VTADAKAAYDLARRLADPDRKKAANRAYYLANKEKVLAKNRQWALDNADLLVARRAEQRDRWLQYGRTYQPRHPEVGRLGTARYRARRQGNLTKSDWQDLLSEFDGRCAYCNVKSDSLQIEHMLPISRGGTHNKANVVPACGTCNRRKGALTPLEYLARTSPSL